jgi:hypothetical protein
MNTVWKGGRNITTVSINGNVKTYCKNVYQTSQSTYLIKFFKDVFAQRVIKRPKARLKIRKYRLIQDETLKDLNLLRFSKKMEAVFPFSTKIWTTNHTVACCCFCDSCLYTRYVSRSRGRCLTSGACFRETPGSALVRAGPARMHAGPTRS